jgi:queuosine precursor transporter
MTNPSSAISIPRSLFIFSLLYGGLVVLAGVLGTKIAEIGPLHVESGIFAFLQLVIISSAIAEIHGKAVADRLVRYGFIPLILSMVMITIVIRIPAAPFWSQQDAFASLLGQGARMQMAGLISYGTSQTLNVYVFSKLNNGKGSALWFRGLIAALLSQAIDTVLFITISFYGVTDAGTGQPLPIWDIMTGQIIAKLALVALVVPIFITLLVRLAKYLDRAET